jgi:pyridoxine/pyridoxamine 5'-phosphate oxidase
LSTVDADGRPSARYVLLKEVDSREAGIPGPIHLVHTACAQQAENLVRTEHGLRWKCSLDAGLQR